MNVYNGLSQRINFPMIFTHNSFCNESTVKTERESKALKEKDPISEMSTTIFQSLVTRGVVARSPEPKAHVSNVRVFRIELELEFSKHFIHIYIRTYIHICICCGLNLSLV